jgi:hypothetical protein
MTLTGATPTRPAADRPQVAVPPAPALPASRRAVVARATLVVPGLPGELAPPSEPIPISRAARQAARRGRQREALAGIGVLVGAFGVTVAVLDVLH